MIKKGFFITGSDTGVGKTIFSSILMKKYNYEYWKPVQTGKPTDHDTLYIKNLKIKSSRFYAPSYILKKPLSPHLAAGYQKVLIDIKKINKPSSSIPLIIEGAGGILVPLNKKNLIIDLIKKFKLPVIVVSKSILGTINHTLMTLEILKMNNIEVFGVVLNNIKNKKEGNDNAKSIETFGKIKVLAKIPFIKNINKKKIKKLSKSKFMRSFKI
tara:strand:+ start:338 stop:976 length:639 start_codon:yes stop_codon:yes gene_type:complete